MNQYRLEVGVDMEREQEITNMTQDELSRVLERVLERYGELPSGVEVQVDEVQ